MGCCQSKVLRLSVDNCEGVKPIKETKEGLPIEIKGGLMKSSHGSSMISAGALESGAMQSCCSNDDRTLSETSRASMSVFTILPDREEKKNAGRWHSNCEEAESPKKATQKTRRAGIDDEDKLEFEDMESTSEEWDEGQSDTVDSPCSNGETPTDVAQNIVDALKTSGVFHSLDDSALNKVANMMTKEVHKDGDIIIRQGDMPQDTDCMYYVAAGEVHLHISGSQSGKQQIIPKKTGWIFGDIALLFNSPRTASVISSGDCVLYALSRNNFILLMQNAPTIRLLRFLRKLPFLKGVSDNKLISFGKEAEMTTYEKEKPMLLDKDRFYIIRKGRLRMEEGSVSQSHLILSRGNFFNKDEGSRYDALTDVKLISVHHSVYQQLGGADLYLQIVEEAVTQVLTAIGDINVGKLDIAEIVRKTPLLFLSKQDLVVHVDQPIEHLYVIIKGEVEIRKPVVSDLQEFKIKRHDEAQYFGEKWNRTTTSNVDVVVTSERIQLLKIAHKVLSKAGIRQETKPKRSRGLQFSRRVVDAEPLTYEGPEIKFKELQQFRVVGEGEYGSVRLVTHTPSNRQFALKIMNKAAIKDIKTAEHVIMERKMLVRLGGNNFLVGLRGAYQDIKSIYLLMDWVPGGELFSRIIDSGGRLPDHHAVFYAANVVLAYSLMHKQNIIYRDLKPENMLIDRNGYLKLADYGFATVADGSAWTVCGTPDYQAPEIITRQGASKASDFWALGILIYEMLTGDAPFKSPSDDRWDIHRRILSGRFYIPEYISLSAADLITKLLQVKPQMRLGFFDEDLERIKQHAWFRRISWESLAKQKMTAPFIPHLTDATDTSCFDHYNTPIKREVPSVRNTFFDKDRPWSCLWSWIDEF